MLKAIPGQEHGNKFFPRMRDYRIGRADGTFLETSTSNAVGMDDFVIPTLVGAN